MKNFKTKLDAQQSSRIEISSLEESSEQGEIGVNTNTFVRD